ncbi:putative LOC102098806 [Columba livia]|uniref:Putative LOC102098806 n=1 Tax=Columba livia TaxID=8932 RepID=A0A2I0M6U8_COLLI|nr:putative LOC102098806 [Columba livia]
MGRGVDALCSLGAASWALPMASPRQSWGLRPLDPRNIAACQAKMMLHGEREGAADVALGPAARVAAAASGLRCKAVLVLAVCLSATVLPYSLGALAAPIHGSLAPSHTWPSSPASWRRTSDDVVVTRGDLLTQPEVHEDGGMLVGSAGTPGCCLDVADVSCGANDKGQNLGMPAMATARSCSGQKQELPHVLPLQFRLLGVTYTAALSNSSSGRYRQLEEEVRLLLNQVLSSYETFLQANVLEFLNGSVVVRGEALFRGDNPAPTSSHLIRTLVTAASRGRRPFSWQLEPRSVQSGGFSLENLEPEKLSFSLTAFQLGRSRIEALESLTSEVTRCLSAHYPVRNVGITQLRDLHGHLEIDGDIYLDTIVHTDVAEVLQAMTALANCSVDLLSLSVEGKDSPWVRWGSLPALLPLTCVSCPFRNQASPPGLPILLPHHQQTLQQAPSGSA